MQPVLTSNSLVAMATAYLQTRSVMEIMTVEMTVMKTAVSMLSTTYELFLCKYALLVSADRSICMSLSSTTNTTFPNTIMTVPVQVRFHSSRCV